MSHATFEPLMPPAPPPTAPPLRVLLVEDDLDVAAGLGEYLAPRGVEVDFARSASEALHIAAGESFDLMILDIQLPGEDGIGLCRRLKQAHGDVPVLFLTAQGGLATKLDAFAAGALDYVVKPFAPAELLARIRAIAHRAGGPSTQGLVVGDYRLDCDGHLLSRGDLHLPLTALATRLLDALMHAHPASVGRSALVEAVWHGSEPDSAPLRVHVHQLRRQLVGRFGNPLIATIRGVGYRFDPDDDAPPRA